VDFEVLDRNTGELVWGDVLACPTGGTCASAIHEVDRDSVYFSGTGRVHNRLWRRGAEEGRALWPASAKVGHPRNVWATDKYLVVEEANAPFGLHLLNKENGRTERSWAWDETKGAKASSSIRLLADGTVLATRLGAGDGSLAKIARITRGGVTYINVFGGSKLATRAIWSYASAHAFFGLVPTPKEATTSFVYKRLGTGELHEDRAPVIDRPRVVDGQVIVHSHDGTDSIVTAYGVHSAQKRVLSRIATPLRHGQVVPTGDLAMVVLEGEPRPFMMIAPASRKLLGVGSLVQSRRTVPKAMNIGSKLYVAEGRGVQGYALRTMDTVIAKLNRQLSDGDIADAFATWSSISFLAGTAPKVRALLRKVTAQRFLTLRHLLQAGERAEVLSHLVSELGLPELADPIYVGPRLRPLGALLADAFLGGGGTPSPVEAGQWARIGAQVDRLIRRHVNVKTPEGRLDEFRSVVLTLVAILSQAKLDRSAADLMATWLRVAKDEFHGLQALYGQLALGAFKRLFGAIRYDLENADDRIRRVAAELLGRFRHTEAALTQRHWVEPFLPRVMSQDHNRARAAAAELVDGVTARLKKLRKGKGLSRPGCLAVCEAAGATCLNRCRRPRDCTRAVARCQKQCRRKNLPKWRAPGGYPRRGEATKICD
jgi:hypothetical protein